MRKQIHVYFIGSVQGIGFRYTARRLADSFDVSGWVKNLADGRVELVAEQEEDILRDFLNALNNSFNGYIRDNTIEWNEPGADFSGFEIRF